MALQASLCRSVCLAVQLKVSHVIDEFMLHVRYRTHTMHRVNMSTSCLFLFMSARVSFHMRARGVSVLRFLNDCAHVTCF